MTVRGKAEGILFGRLINQLSQEHRIFLLKAKRRRKKKTTEVKEDSL